jgi:hypothetical protein
MSADEEPQAEETEPAGEPEGMSERTAKTVLLVVGLLAGWGIIAAFPYMAYFVAGILACRGWQQARGWLARRRKDNEPPEADQVDVTEALLSLAGDDRGSVLLTALRDELKLPDTKTVKQLLDEARIPWRAGVRTRAGNGPGVHREDLPPLPSPAPSGGVGAGEDANANANNAPKVEALGLAGKVVKDGSEAGRRHTLPQRVRRRSS